MRQDSERTFSICANDNASAILGARLVQRLRRNGAARVRLVFRALKHARLVRAAVRRGAILALYDLACTL